MVAVEVTGASDVNMVADVAGVDARGDDVRPCRDTCGARLGGVLSWSCNSILLSSSIEYVYAQKSEIYASYSFSSTSNNEHARQIVWIKR